ncbi:MAG: ABC transporter substrate-binding protein [Candidatus Kapaibacterium sp.]|jgi:branched-chain amino acid transport system substrate-binding protein
MSENKTSKGFSRRGFLQTIGLASGAAVVAPFTGVSIGSAVAKSVFGGAPIKVGVIMQRGSWTTESALSGMLLHLKEINNTVGGRPVQLIVEEIGKGTGSLAAKTAKLVEKDNVDVVIANVNSRAAQSVREYVDTHKVAFVEMNAGEVITAHSAVSPTYFRSTLNLWQAHAAMGTWAANTIGKKASILTSFANSGFDFHPAFQLGFEAAGGTIVSHRVTGSPTGADHPMLAISDLPKNQADVLYASYSDQSAYGFVQAFKSSGLDTPVLGTNFHEGLHGASSNAAQLSGSRYAGSWSVNMKNAENASFVKSYEKFAGKSADEFAVLGNDTLRMVLAAAQRNTNIAEGLLEVGLTGPRGEMRFDKTSHSLLTQVFLIEDNASGAKITELEYAASTRATAAASTVSGLKSGWLNSYLAG